jgi:DNA-binding CsgD family transcriptional regulator
VNAGEVWASQVELGYVLQALQAPASMILQNVKGESLLTIRERELVSLVAAGLTNREIAVRMSIREHTVKNYLFRIFDKLGVSSRVELILYATSHNDHTRIA